jgi:hypothetical protein
LIERRDENRTCCEREQPTALWPTLRSCASWDASGSSQPSGGRAGPACAGAGRHGPHRHSLRHPHAASTLCSHARRHRRPAGGCKVGGGAGGDHGRRSSRQGFGRALLPRVRLDGPGLAGCRRRRGRCSRTHCRCAHAAAAAAPKPVRRPAPTPPRRCRRPHIVPRLVAPPSPTLVPLLRPSISPLLTPALPLPPPQAPLETTRSSFAPASPPALPCTWT